MSDYVWKMIPYEPFETDYIEAWLDDMATKGLLLQTISIVVVKFKKIKPSHIRFCMDMSPTMDQRKDSERRSFFIENGWQYVTMFSDRYTIYKTEDPDLTKLPIDHAEDRYSLKYTDLTSAMIALIVSINFIAVDINAYIDGHFSFLFNLWYDPFTVSFLLLLIALIMFAANQLIAFRRWQQRAQQSGVRLRSERTVRRERIRIIVKMSLFMAILYGFITFFFIAL